MIIREPVVAGRFYPDDPQACREAVARLFHEAAEALDAPDGPGRLLPERIVGGIVPHAGWAFSGEPAARTLEAIARSRGRGSGIGDRPTADPRSPAPVFVLFGAMHRAGGGGREGLLFDRGVWRSPLGDIAIDERLAQRIVENTNLISANPAAHRQEHSIEVQIPLIQFRFPDAKIVPIIVPPTVGAHEVGLAVGRTLEIFGIDAVVLGSTDLTHYGPGYMFIPRGPGPSGLKWAKQVNDAGIIDVVVKLDAERAVVESSSHLSACGGGAVAATLAAARKLGATRGVVLEHVTSYEVLLAKFGQRSADAVGYLSAVLGN